MRAANRKRSLRSLQRRQAAARRRHTWSFNKESNPNNTDRAQDSNAYAQVGFAGVTIGAAMEFRPNFGDDGAD
jgi:hypothetical protein